MKRTPLSWDPPEVGDLAVIYNGLDPKEAIQTLLAKAVRLQHL